MGETAGIGVVREDDGKNGNPDNPPVRQWVHPSGGGKLFGLALMLLMQQDEMRLSMPSIEKRQKPAMHSV